LKLRLNWQLRLIAKAEKAKLLVIRPDQVMADERPWLSPAEPGVSTMILQDALPGIKRFLAPLGRNDHVQGHVSRLVTAFDAESIREACAERGFKWIVPINPERVLAGPKGKRPKVWSLAGKWTAAQFATVRLTPGQGPYVAQRRIAACRLGRKVKPRTFYVHKERRNVHSVGDVQLVFSTKEKPQTGKPVVVQKILMSNDRQRSAAALVELYDLRWQIELFFKELKSTLGMHQYRFRDFRKVESWVASCLVTFLYLEWYRSQQLRKRDLTAQDKNLCMAVRQDTEESELNRLARRTRTPGGVKKLKKELRAAVPAEYRKAA
jgi:hypothetical protein